MVETFEEYSIFLDAVQAGKPMTVKGEAALPRGNGAGFAPMRFFFFQISSGGERSEGGASAPLQSVQHG